MIIDADFGVSFTSAEDLLRCMKKENITKCNISVSSMGQNLIAASVTQEDVSVWIALNEKE